MFVGQRLDMFFSRQGFAGQSSFLDLQPGSFDQPHIGRNDLARFQNDNIAGNQLALPEW